jgi:mono/diheme cytochrome c family protein
LLAAALAFPAVAAADVQRGKAIVETNCSACHAIGRTGQSTHPDAPPFRTLSSRYPIDDLEEALAEGISTGHPDMPQFIASPEQAESIIEYLKSIQER